MPYVGNAETSWMNGIYDSVLVLFLFPLLVYMGASGKTTDNITKRLCRLLGDISYPLYMIHYPFMYLFYAWVWKHDPALTLAETWPVALLLFFGNIALAYLVMKFYDIPVRRWLTNKYMPRK